MPQYHMFMFLLMEKLWDEMKICCWAGRIMANLEMFPFVLMMSSCAEWTVIAEFKT